MVVARHEKRCPEKNKKNIAEHFLVCKELSSDGVGVGARGGAPYFRRYGPGAGLKNQRFRCKKSLRGGEATVERPPSLPHARWKPLLMRATIEVHHFFSEVPPIWERA